MAWLCQGKGGTEVRDTAGKVIGFFAPCDLSNEQASVLMLAQMGLNELKRRGNSKEKGSTLAEIWERLRLLDAENERRITAGLPRFIDDEAVEFVDMLREKYQTVGGITDLPLVSPKG